MEVRNIGKHGVRVEGDVPRTSYHAHLMTTEPVRGKRRQRIIAYQGGYQDREPDDLDVRMEFWRAVEQRLAALDVHDVVKERIVTTLAKQMPRPTSAEVDAASAL